MRRLILVLTLLIGMAPRTNSQMIISEYAHDSLDGFQGFLWGTSFRVIDSAFKLSLPFDSSDDGRTKSYKADITELAGATISSFACVFFDDRFLGITFTSQGKENVRKLRVIFKTKYGHQTQEGHDAEKYHWDSGATSRFAELNSISDLGTFTFISWPMLRRMQAAHAQYLIRPPKPEVQISMKTGAMEASRVDSTQGESTIHRAIEPSPSIFGAIGLVAGLILIFAGVALAIVWIIFPILVLMRLTEIRDILRHQG